MESEDTPFIFPYVLRYEEGGEGPNPLYGGCGFHGEASWPLFGGVARCPGTVVRPLLAVLLGLEFSLEGAVPRYNPGAMGLLCPPTCSPQRSILRGTLGDLLQKSPSWGVKVGLCSW